MKEKIVYILNNAHISVDSCIHLFRVICKINLAKFSHLSDTETFSANKHIKFTEYMSGYNFTDTSETPRNTAFLEY